jgi:hypothetical protein
LGGVVLAAFVVFAVASLMNLQSGMHGDPRTTNPVPGARPYPPFLGVDNWPLVMSTVAVLLTIGFFGVGTWNSLRRRRVHWSLIIGVAGLIAGAVDPLANWATFTMFDPRTFRSPGPISTSLPCWSQRCRSWAGMPSIAR